jgi:PTH1 family peptidyl-tRNA hydrolase
MKIIVGLGNPGRRYEATPHNLGFQVVDELARRWSLSFREVRQARAEVAEGMLAGKPALLVKPQTFMNLSGESVSVLTRQRELGQDDLLVITDDVALPIGRLRIRPRGSHGGHNGLRSIVERVGHEDFARLRVG